MDLWKKDDIAQQRQMIIEAVLRYVRPGDDAAAQVGSGTGVVGAQPVCR